MQPQHRKQSAPTLPAVSDPDLAEFERRCREASEAYARVLRLGELMQLHDAVAESQRARWGHE